MGEQVSRPWFSPGGTLTIALLLLALTASGVWMMRMPGKSLEGPPPPLTGFEQALAAHLEADVRHLAGEIGERNMHVTGTMEAAADWIEQRFRASGLSPEREHYTLRDGRQATNLFVQVPGLAQPDRIVVIGAHYDTVPGSPGANDNASGIAAVLALADHFAERPVGKTLRFVAFANEEPPFFTTPDMGSHAHARRARERGDDIVAMMALDGLGYFDDSPGSQRFPAAGMGLFYPDRADFIAVVSRMRDAALTRRALGAFREQASIPSEGAALPGVLPGVGWSDHWSFWQHGYPAFLVTDTLPFRDPDYHSPADTPDRLDYPLMARVVAGLKTVIQVLGE